MEGSFTIPSHAEDLTKCMYELQQDGTFCDAGLECKDGVIFVHKLVLMACRSPYLRNQLMCESQGERVYVSLKNYSLKTVCRLVQTLYTGQLNISQENEVDFRHLCETIELDNIKSAAENFIQQDQIIYEVESVNQFCAVQVEEEIIESQDGITALVASVNHGPDDNLVDSTNTVDNGEDLNNDSSDVKVGGDTVKRNQDSEGERETNKSLDPPTMATGRETRSNKRRKIFHNENPSQAKDNATSSNMAEILTIAKQLSGIDETQPSKSASSYLDQTKSSLCSLCTKEFVNKGENVTDPGKPVCTECMVLFSGETNDDQEMGTKSDQTQSDNSEDGGGDSKKDSVALEEECLKKTCEEGSPLPEEADSEPLPWLQDKVDVDGCEKNVISDRKLRYKSQSDKGKTETGETIQEKMWHCKKCEFSTCDKKEHERHRKRHTYIERKNRISKLCKPPKYSCDECRNEYKTKCGLIHHKKIAHSNKPILRCLLTGCKTRFVEESALQKHMVWHNCQGVLKCRKCAKVFVLKGALERHEDYCIKRVMFRCDICNKVYKGQKDLADHVRKLHGKVKGFKYWKSVHLEQHDQEHDYNDAVTYSEAQVPSKIEGININDKTTKPEGDVDNVDEFVKEMNSIILTQKNKKKISQTKDVYRCTKCDFATDDKRKYNSHRGHHNYEIHKQRSAEPQTYTCDKCKKEYKTSVALKSHTKKVHTGTVIFECPQKDSVDLEEECLKKTCEERSPLPDLISLEEDDCDPLPWLQEQIEVDGCETNEISDRNLRNKSQSEKGEKESGETNQVKMWHCKKCEFSTGDKKEHGRHYKRHQYIERKLRMSNLCKPPKYSCNECGNEYKTENGLIEHKKLAHSAKPILRCVLRGCKSRFVEESALQKHLLWHKSQGVLKCRKCAQVFVLKGALKRHEDYCVNRLMFRCDICNKVYKAQKNLSEHMSKIHCEGGKGFNYRESLKLSNNINSATSGVDQNKGASLTVENTSLETTMKEFNDDNVEEFVEGMNSILLTQRNEKKSRQTQDVYRCTHCEFSTEDKTQYTKHRKHHDYLKSKQKQKSAEPKSHTCDKCETDHKTTLASKVHTEKVHSLVLVCPEKGCFKCFSDEHQLNDHLLNHEEIVLIKCGKCKKSFESKHDLNKHDVICIPTKTVQSDTASKNNKKGDGEVDNDDMDDMDNDDEDDDGDGDIEGIVKTLNKAIDKERKSKVYKCEKCNFSTKDYKDYERHRRRHRYLKDKESHIHNCRYCGLTFRTIPELSKHELTFHSDQFYKCKAKSCTSVFKYKLQLEQHISKHKNMGLYKCKNCKKKFVFKDKLTPHEDKCIRNMTPNEHCHLCGKQFGSKSGLLRHMRKHNDGVRDCFCGKNIDSIKNLNQHKKYHNDPMLERFCEKQISEESDNSTDSNSDGMDTS